MKWSHLWFSQQFIEQDIAFLAYLVAVKYYLVHVLSN
jgi:hypothetical protein